VALVGLLGILLVVVITVAIEGRDPTPIGTAILGFVGGRYFPR